MPPVEDDLGVIPEPHVEKFVDHISAYEFQNPARQGRDEKYQKRLFPDLNGEREYHEGAEAVDRDPGAESSAALKELALIDIYADRLIDKADDACDREDHHEKRDKFFGALFHDLCLFLSCAGHPYKDTIVVCFYRGHYTSHFENQRILIKRRLRPQSIFVFDFADILLSEMLTFSKSQLFGYVSGRKFKAEKRLPESTKKGAPEGAPVDQI